MITRNITKICDQCGSRFGYGTAPPYAVGSKIVCGDRCRLDAVEEAKAEANVADAFPAEAVAVINAVVSAWTIEGPAPFVHRIAKNQLTKEWPTLANAVRELVKFHAKHESK